MPKNALKVTTGRFSHHQKTKNKIKQQKITINIASMNFDPSLNNRFIYNIIKNDFNY